MNHSVGGGPGFRLGGQLPCLVFMLIALFAARAEGLSGIKSRNGPSLDCQDISAATKPTNQDVCVAAHVYDVVELRNGTRFLDVCPPEVADESCQFTIVSLPEDRTEVGDLRRYRDQNVQVRGLVHSMNGRMGIVVSHERQFNGGPEKFRPNPKLLRGFNGQSDRRPVRDPNLSSSRRGRSFMNLSDRETLPKTR